MRINQEELAERMYISPRQLSRIETGEKQLDIWQFVSILETLGLPSEDYWLLYLETQEYEDYRRYRLLKRLIREEQLNEQYIESKKVLAQLEDSLLAQQPFIRQFVAYVKIKVSVELSPEQAIKELYKALSISKPDFDENKVSEYRLNYNEIFLINNLASRYGKLKNYERAIALYKGIIEGRKKIQASEDDKAALFPPIMFSLSNMLGMFGKHKESLKYCERALEVCREYDNLRLVPRIMHNMAINQQLLNEEERVYRLNLVRAYHCAYAIGDNSTAITIKKDAEENFGITDLDL